MKTDVFVIMPFADTFRRTYKAIESALGEAGQKCTRSDLDRRPGLIIEQIHENIRFSMYCIVDVSPDPRYHGQPNPNVLYELGVAHAQGTPVVLITRGRETDLPFNLRNFRLLKYSPHRIGELKNALLDYAKEIKGNEESDASLLSQMLAPASIRRSRSPFIVAASPLSFRSAFQSQGGWDQSPMTFSDYSGVRGILQAFGTMYQLKKKPELVTPDDYRKSVLSKPMHLYCIGSPKANRWSGSVMRSFFETHSPEWEFQVDPSSKDLMNPRVRIARNGTDFDCGTNGRIRIQWDYGLLIRGSNPNSPGSQFMLMAGRSALGTMAACMAATTPEHISTFKKQVREEGISIDLRNHRQAFCTVVSMSAHIQPNKEDGTGRETNQWRIHRNSLKFEHIEALNEAGQNAGI